MSDKEIIQKYNLPNEEVLTAELGPYDSEEKGLISTIINKLLEKSQKYTSFIEEMLHPDSNLTSMQEASMFSNEEREKLFSLFKELTSYQRKSLLLSLSTDEKEKATYCKEFFEFFLSKKEELRLYVKQAISIWSTISVPQKNNQGYFG